MVLYLDIVLLKEFIMDIILLVCTSLVLKKKTSSIRIIIGGIIGIIETAIECIISFNYNAILILKILISILMIKIIFKTKDIKKFTKELFTFYLITFCIGGFATSVFFSTNLHELFMENYFRKYSDIIIVLLGICGGFFIYIVLRQISLCFDKKNMIYNVEIKIENKIIKTKILVDTGNLLKEKSTGYAVLVLQKDKLNEIEDIKNKKKYLIPYKTLGSESFVMLISF